MREHKNPIKMCKDLTEKICLSRSYKDTPKENVSVTNAVNAFNDGAITIDQMWDKIFEDIDGVVLEDECDNCHETELYGDEICPVCGREG